jgi:hypothetical protein
VDSLALSVCQFTRAPRCRRFRGEAAYGQDHLTRLPFYGFRIQARVCWPGVICQFEVTPGNASEMEAARDLTQGTIGLLLGDRNFWSPRLKVDLADHQIRLLASFRHRKQDPWPAWSYLLSQWRYRIDMVFGPLVDRTALKRVWAKDFWHLCHRRLDHDASGLASFAIHSAHRLKNMHIGTHWLPFCFRDDVAAIVGSESVRPINLLCQA